MYVIGLDIGTTGTKALLVDTSGALLGSGYKGYPLLTDGKCVEQDAGNWWSASIAAIREAVKGIDASQVEAIGISTQGATTVAVNKSGKQINNAITWLDGRATAQAKEIKDKLGEEYIYQTTGWRLSPSLDAAKILYMKESGNYKEAAYYLSTLEYINYLCPVCITP